MGFFQVLKQLFGLNKSAVANDGSNIKQQQFVGTRFTNSKEMDMQEGMTKLEESTCPYCGFQFDKPLSRKRACPDCKRNIYVRTLPFDNELDKTRVAVTEEQAENIDIAWAKKNGTYEELIKEKKNFEKMKKSLEKSWGKEPSTSDIEWHLLIEERLEHANNNQWGLYRNTTLRMAEHLYRLESYDLSLRTYLEVLYLDLNGPKNAGKINGQYHLGKHEKVFDPQGFAFVAPGIIKRIVLLKNKRIPTNDKQVKTLFIENGEQIYHALQLPLSPSLAWSNFEADNLFWGNQS
ncbi:hypothetical protein CSV79_13145 [Sporosarcina sp. P13]|uniref:hypothetical protein n=1 Tax=Sporosarcina sp. P13 TaxID=2048263 RepID=UPI000C16E708|nr:hypothetical protein [Sporosarcina sp. P13]PIC63155.1 hypothetical protein CSV79_13145 [Sporosarcina sp. P13]